MIPQLEISLHKYHPLPPVNSVSDELQHITKRIHDGIVLNVFLNTTSGSRQFPKMDTCIDLFSDHFIKLCHYIGEQQTSNKVDFPQNWHINTSTSLHLRKMNEMKDLISKGIRILSFSFEEESNDNGILGGNSYGYELDSDTKFRNDENAKFSLCIGKIIFLTPRSLLNPSLNKIKVKIWEIKSDCATNEITLIVEGIYVMYCN